MCTGVCTGVCSAVSQPSEGSQSDQCGGAALISQSCKVSRERLQKQMGLLLLIGDQDPRLLFSSASGRQVEPHDAALRSGSNQTFDFTDPNADLLHISTVLLRIFARTGPSCS